ncbi:MAG: FtsX-like permease family protein [Planctomycetales bacterium]|nr:FtsX-like permease family protein [Planctomycetales bacterium]NIM08641.1 FtsX-like permease family protein [Planctomycetales bacterium]NIN08109.1 FtsX-like permease family protein [Planctomycetales bacterium]NIN77234.1 FtsX-like permease family protein [Planctomycetales bacterium]NIO34423.1 FtsX-like permease family protein [Planctomycetales bacterium]
MYKLLLCWRYLRTRYIALASIISVTLGVATLIVVNSVMSGFTQEMEHRIHNILSDIVFESHGLEGFSDADWHIARIGEIVGDRIAGITPTVHVPAMLNFQVGGRWVHRQVNFIGIDPETYGQVTDCGQYLQHPKNRSVLSFQLREGGYDQRDHTGGAQAVYRHGMQRAGWPHRRIVAAREKAWLEARHARAPGDAAERQSAADPFAGIETPRLASASDQGVVQEWEPLGGKLFDKASEQHTGIVMGLALARFRGQDGEDHFLNLPGDDVRLTFPTAGTPPKAVSGLFTIVDFYESKMSEYDSAFVFVPLKKLQEMRGMIHPTTGVANVTAIQIRLKEGVDLNGVRDDLRAAFPPELYGISTWRDKQGPLLAAVQMETAILNILLFLIIAVAGFGILAIFFMIVVEKTKDIGVLKSLGASAIGIMSIFLSYGLCLGTVGSGAGLLLGLLFVANIDRIRVGLERLTGQEVFDPSIYYFQEIPAIVQPMTVAWVIAGAISIAVLASILPALRAARLHPVEALRYE